MQHTRQLLIVLFISAGFYSCATTRGNIGDKVSFEKLPIITPQENKLVNTELPTPETVRIYKDSLFLVTNNLNGNKYHARVFDINSRAQVNNLLPAGGIKGGTLSFMSVGISDSLVWVFDVAKNGFIVGDLGIVLDGNKGPEYYSEYRIKPQVFYYDAVLLNRNEALLSGNYDTDEKLTYINFQDSTRKKTLLSYSNDSLTGDSRINKMAYESFMLLRPDKKKVVLASRYADQLEFFDLENGTSKRVSGPEGFAPELVPFENNAGVTVATIGPDSRYGFLRGCVTQPYIYLLFSGNNVRSPRRFYGNRIFVFDWDGNPVKQIQLKNDIIGLTVSSDDKSLYTLNPSTKFISLFELE
ncbi:MAG: hypothetical protein J7527_11210 [Chitinophagaceae bacterium]|nr:hypothetical protein [Chitinophagaceae bacterium]